MEVPGVHIEESPGPHTIQGVSTSTAAFIGPCRFGPTSGRPELLTSYQEFAAIYGDTIDLTFADNGTAANYVALGVRGFFDEGGRQLYVARTFAYTSPEAPTQDHAVAEVVPVPGTTPASPLTLRARFPGRAGNLRVTFTLRARDNALAAGNGEPTLTGVQEYDAVWAVGSSTPEGDVYVVRRDEPTGGWTLAGGRTRLSLADAIAVQPITVLVETQRPTADPEGRPVFEPALLLGELDFDPRAAGTGLSDVLSANPPTRTQALTVPIILDAAEVLGTPLTADEVPNALATALLGPTVLATAADPGASLQERQVVVTLDNGSDGNAPGAIDYDGDPVRVIDHQNDPTALPLNGLHALESLEDVSVVAAPGASTGWSGEGADATAGAHSGQAINDSVIRHCERMRYRMAVLDTPPHLLPDDASRYRSRHSSANAALYYPWITVSHPIRGDRVDIPPAPCLAGVWAPSDTGRGVAKAPANEVILSALDLQSQLSSSQAEVLSQQGVNSLRLFAGRGIRVWGARTISDDPEWKYVNIRRLFLYLEHSIDAGTRWAVFEDNGPPLWSAIRHTVEDFLLREWRNGALLGATPDEAFFVRCDASTMTADDLANGRLICEIGIAPVRPAEFVIFRIGQRTASTPWPPE